MPDLVVLYLDAEDPAACRLLSVLNLDRVVSAIPCIAWITCEERCAVAPQWRVPPRRYACDTCEPK